MLWNGWKAFDTPSLSTKSINARMKRTSGTHIHIFNRLYCLSNRIKLAESRAYKRLVSLDHVSLHAYCVFVFTVLCKCGITSRLVDVIVVVFVVVIVQKQPSSANRQLRLLVTLMKIRLHPQTLHLVILRKRVNVTKQDFPVNELGMKRISLNKRGLIRQ